MIRPPVVRDEPRPARLSEATVTLPAAGLRPREDLRETIIYTCEMSIRCEISILIDN